MEGRKVELHTLALLNLHVAYSGIYHNEEQAVDSVHCLRSTLSLGVDTHQVFGCMRVVADNAQGRHLRP
jgi:hypothetical protein